VFEVTLEAAQEAGLVGRRRVLDSTVSYDAVATIDTVTLIRSAIRGVVKVCEPWEEQQLRAVLARDDDYRQAGSLDISLVVYVRIGAHRRVSVDGPVGT
jgi:hypothetical protein